MNVKLIALALVAGLALPAAAQAHTTRAELRHDRQAVHHEKRELRRAVAHRNWDRARHERRDLASARHEYHADKRDYRRSH